MAKNSTTVMMDECLSNVLSIDRLLSYKFLGKDQFPFSIPSYQRGYRWTTENVRALLEDLLEFKEGQSSLYCLQPIVFKRCKIDVESKQREIFRIVDGQQRLTTMTILLRELGVAVPWDMYYETVTVGDEDVDAQEKGKWLSDLLDDPDNDGGINGHFRKTNAEFIKTWIEKEGGRKEQLRGALGIAGEDAEVTAHGKSVAFIGYLMNNSVDSSRDEHELFDRLNDGRVPLTSAELIKALFEVSTSGLNDVDKLEISKEWELIEQGLHDEKFWRVFKSDNKTPFTRIEELFAVVADTKSANRANDTLAVYHDVEKMVVWKVSGGDTEKRTPDERRDALKDLWQKVLELYRWMRSCVRDHEMANYIGWIALFRTVSIVKLYKSYAGYSCLDDGEEQLVEGEFEELNAHERRAGRWECFKKNLMSYILNRIKTIYPDVFVANNLSSVRYVKDDRANARNLRELFVLLNVCACNASHEFFRFDRYVAERSGMNPEESEKGYGWDVDHIFLQSEAENSEVDGIWNLALIDARTNRSEQFKVQGAKSFDSKRKCIQGQMSGSAYENKAMVGMRHYILPLSQRVYMKFYSKEMSGTTWEKENDGLPYQEALETFFSDFKNTASAVEKTKARG